MQERGVTIVRSRTVAQLKCLRCRTEHEISGWLMASHVPLSVETLLVGASVLCGISQSVEHSGLVGRVLGLHVQKKPEDSRLMSICKCNCMSTICNATHVLRGGAIGIGVLLLVLEDAGVVRAVAVGAGGRGLVLCSNSAVSILASTRKHVMTHSVCNTELFLHEVRMQ